MKNGPQQIALILLIAIKRIKTKTNYSHGIEKWYTFELKYWYTFQVKPASKNLHNKDMIISCRFHTTKCEL